MLSFGWFHWEEQSWCRFSDVTVPEGQSQFCLGMFLLLAPSIPSDQLPSPCCHVFFRRRCLSAVVSCDQRTFLPPVRLFLVTPSWEGMASFWQLLHKALWSGPMNWYLKLCCGTLQLLQGSLGALSCLWLMPSFPGEFCWVPLLAWFVLVPWWLVLVIEMGVMVLWGPPELWIYSFVWELLVGA